MSSPVLVISPFALSVSREDAGLVSCVEMGERARVGG